MSEREPQRVSYFMTPSKTFSIDCNLFYHLESSKARTLETPSTAIINRSPFQERHEEKPKSRDVASSIFKFFLLNYFNDILFRFIGRPEKGVWGGPFKVLLDLNFLLNGSLNADRPDEPLE